eukprot:5662934-Ditylum_brightwellii.AAC.1
MKLSKPRGRVVRQNDSFLLLMKFFKAVGQPLLCFITGYLCCYNFNAINDDNNLLAPSKSIEAPSSPGVRAGAQNIEEAGWNSINVFYGSDKYLGGKNHKSQCGQDKIVA